MRVKRAFQITLGIGVLILVFAVPSPFVAGSPLSLPRIPIALEAALALAAAPLLFPGILASGVEKRVRRRERNYAAFIRSLGSSMEARGGSLEQSLHRVRSQNLGPLEEQVERLHNRLSWRVDEEKAWRHFAAESGSHLIGAFTHMFVEGLRAGSKPGATSSIISKNVMAILNLRASRVASGGAFRSMAYGLVAGVAFILLIAAGILERLNGLFDQASAFGNENLPIELSLAFDGQAVHFVLVLIIIAYAAFAAVFQKMVEGGSVRASLMLFVVLTWIGMAVSGFTRQLAPKVLGAG